MKMIIPEFNSPMQILENAANTLVIENPACFFRFVTDVNEQICKNDGRIILSENEMILDISKTVIMLQQYVPFDFNRKTLANRLQQDLCDISLSKYPVETNEAISHMLALIYKLGENVDFELDIGDFDISAILKMANVKFADDFSSLSEKLYQYCKAVSVFEGEKLFLFVNLHSYISDRDFSLFSRTLIDHKILSLFVENREYSRIAGENRIIIDNDLCIM